MALTKGPSAFEKDPNRNLNTEKYANEIIPYLDTYQEVNLNKVLEDYAAATGITFGDLLSYRNAIENYLKTRDVIVVKDSLHVELTPFTGRKVKSLGSFHKFEQQQELMDAMQLETLRLELIKLEDEVQKLQTNELRAKSASVLSALSTALQAIDLFKK